MFIEASGDCTFVDIATYHKDSGFSSWHTPELDYPFEVDKWMPLPDSEGKSSDWYQVKPKENHKNKVNKEGQICYKTVVCLGNHVRRNKWTP